MIWVNLIFSLTQGCLDFVFQVFLLKAFCSPLKKKMKKKKKRNQPNNPSLPLPKNQPNTQTSHNNNSKKPFIILKKRAPGMRWELNFLTESQIIIILKQPWGCSYDRLGFTSPAPRAHSRDRCAIVIIAILAYLTHFYFLLGTQSSFPSLPCSDLGMIM